MGYKLLLAPLHPETSKQNMQPSKKNQKKNIVLKEMDDMQSQQEYALGRASLP